MIINLLNYFGLYTKKQLIEECQTVSDEAFLRGYTKYIPTRHARLLRYQLMFNRGLNKGIETGRLEDMKNLEDG